MWITIKIADREIWVYDPNHLTNLFINGLGELLDKLKENDCG